MACVVLVLAGCGSRPRTSAVAQPPPPAPAVNDNAPGPPADLLTPRSPAVSRSPSAKPRTSPTRKATPTVKPTTPASDVLVVLGAAAPHTFAVARGGTTVRGTGGRLLRYKVAVEKGLSETPAGVSATVDPVLGNLTRGWLAGGALRFQRVFAGAADFIVELATPATTDDICRRHGLITGGQVSCRGQQDVVINLARWERGTNGTTEGATVYSPADYRILVINHEVGHALGHGHLPCAAAGAPAPVMMPSYFGLDGCVQNLWPYGADGTYVG
jgi:hypothetical protein